MVRVNEESAPEARSLDDRWADFDEAYVAFRAGADDGHPAWFMATIEALVDCYWQQGVVDTLEERAEILPRLAPVIATCWWGDHIPADLIARLDRLAEAPHSPTRRDRQARFPTRR
jgi:hypothetical protein